MKKSHEESQSSEYYDFIGKTLRKMDNIHLILLRTTMVHGLLLFPDL